MFCFIEYLFKTIYRSELELIIGVFLPIAGITIAFLSVLSSFGWGETPPSALRPDTTLTLLFYFMSFHIYFN